MIRRRIAVSMLCFVSFSLTVQASNLDNIAGLGQAEFRLLSEDLGAILSYKPLSPSEPLGITGFDLGIEVSATKLENPAIYATATTDSVTDTLYLPKLHLHKGLPFGFDVGASYTALPDSNIKAWGAEVRYALLRGGTSTPAIALRGSYSALEGVSQLELTTTGVDLSISKGFTLFTPYAGIGRVWVSSKPDPVTGRTPEDFDLDKVFAGLNLNLAIINIAVEADKTGEATSYGIKFGWRF